MGREARELLEACRDGNLGLVEAILASRARRPRTPLSFLKGGGTCWLSATKELSSGYTALHLAALHGQARICSALLRATAPADIPVLLGAKDRRGNLPLHLGAWSGHAGLVGQLLAADPTSLLVNAENNGRETPLHLAAQHGHLQAAAALLKSHADPLPRNARGETALDLAARFGRTPVARFLIAHSPALVLAVGDPSTTAPPSPRIPGSGPVYTCPAVSPLHLAARNGHLDIVRLLLDSGFSLSWLTEEGSALHVAALFGQVDVVKELLSRGIERELRDWQGRTAEEVLAEHEGQRAHAELTQLMQHRDAWAECSRLITQHYDRSSGTGRRVQFIETAEEKPLHDAYANMPPREASPVWHRLESELSEASRRRRPPSNDGTQAADDILFRPPPIQSRCVDSATALEELIAAEERRGAPCLCPPSPASSTLASLPSPSPSSTSGAWQNPEHLQPSSPGAPPKPARRAPAPCTYSDPAYAALGTVKTGGDPAWFRYDNLSSSLMAYDNAPHPTTGHRRWDHACREELESVNVLEESLDEARLLASLRDSTPVADLSPPEPSPIPPPSPRLARRHLILDRDTVEVISDNTSLRSVSALIGEASGAPLALPEEDALGGSTTEAGSLEDSSPDGAPRLPAPGGGRLPEVKRRTDDAVPGSAKNPSPPSTSIDTTSTLLNPDASETQPPSPGIFPTSQASPRPVSSTSSRPFDLLDEPTTDSTDTTNTTQPFKDSNSITDDSIAANSTVNDLPSASVMTQDVSSPVCSPTTTHQDLALTPDEDPPSAADSQERISQAIRPLSQMLRRQELLASPQSALDARDEGTQAQTGASSDDACSCEEVDNKADLNESAEWAQINELLSTASGSVQAKQPPNGALEPTAHPIPSTNGTLELRNLTRSPLGVSSPLEEWLGRQEIREPHIVADILTQAGFDSLSFLPGTLTVEILSQLLPERVDLRTWLAQLAEEWPEKAVLSRHEYVSDWLLALGCQDYLGNFVRAGLDTVPKLSHLDWSDELLRDGLGIASLGHRRRILRSVAGRTETDKAEEELKAPTVYPAAFRSPSLPTALADAGRHSAPAAVDRPDSSQASTAGTTTETTPGASGSEDEGTPVPESANEILFSSGEDLKLLKVEVEEVEEEGGSARTRRDPSELIHGCVSFPAHYLGSTLLPSLDEPAGKEVEEEGGSARTRRDPSELIHGCVSFPAHYLGSTLLPSLDEPAGKEVEEEGGSARTRRDPSELIHGCVSFPAHYLGSTLLPSLDEPAGKEVEEEGGSARTRRDPSELIHGCVSFPAHYLGSTLLPSLDEPAGKEVEEEGGSARTRRDPSELIHGCVSFPAHYLGSTLLPSLDEPAGKEVEEEGGSARTRRDPSELIHGCVSFPAHYLGSTLLPSLDEPAGKEVEEEGGSARTRRDPSELIHGCVSFPAHYLGSTLLPSLDEPAGKEVEEEGGSARTRRDPSELIHGCVSFPAHYLGSTLLPSLDEPAGKEVEEEGGSARTRRDPSELIHGCVSFPAHYLGSTLLPSLDEPAGKEVEEEGGSARTRRDPSELIHGCVSFPAHYLGSTLLPSLDEPAGKEVEEEGGSARTRRDPSELIHGCVSFPAHYLGSTLLPSLDEPAGKEVEEEGGSARTRRDPSELIHGCVSFPAHYLGSTLLPSLDEPAGKEVEEEGGSARTRRDPSELIHGCVSFPAHYLGSTLLPSLDEPAGKEVEEEGGSARTRRDPSELIHGCVSFPAHYLGSTLLPSLDEPAGKEVEEEGGSARTRRDPSELIHGCVSFPAHYLGSTLLPSLDEPAGKEVEEEGGSARTRRDPSELIHGCVSFPAHYLGSTLLPSLDEPADAPRKAIVRMKKSIRDIAKIPQVILNISYRGVKITDGLSKKSLTAHAIHNIHCVCQDERDLNCFAYITKDRTRHFCHVFSVLTADLATEIILTLGQAFEVAYQLATKGQPPPEPTSSSEPSQAL